ncbi:MAG: PASTA domain-containing protein [Proteobacteria bacterium]|nr:PASTA domain-containing protein [Pseudomonadota bacterium]
MSSKKKKNISFLVYFLIIAVSFVAGFIIVNYLIMPMVVGKGEDISVPALIGLDLKDAQRVVKNNSLIFNIAGYQYDTLYQKDKVIFQDPKPDNILKKGRKVSVIVSMGAKSYTMPYIQGIPLKNGLAVLKKMNITNGTNKIYTSSDSFPKDYIVSTIPRSDETIDPGSMITIFVSKGSESDTLQMPNLIGLNLKMVVDTIKSLNLILTGVDSDTTVDSLMSKVILQYPEDGTKLSPGDSVSIVTRRE